MSYLVVVFEALVLRTRAIDDVRWPTFVTVGYMATEIKDSQDGEWVVH